MMMKKYIYAICTLLLVGCMASRKSPENKTIGKEKVTIDSLAPNPFIRHIHRFLAFFSSSFVESDNFSEM